MRHILRLRRCFSITGIAVITLALAATDALATHLRGVTLSWAPTGTSRQVRFTIKYAQRWTYPNSPGVCGGTQGACPALGSSFSLGTGLVPAFNFGDGSTGIATGTVTSINQAEDWFIADVTVVHTYPGDGPYTAFFESSARISSLKLGHDQNLRMETTVRPGTTNHSPVASMPAIVSVPLTNPTGFALVASDFEHDTLRYRLATSLEMYNSGNSPCLTAQPPGLAINSSTGQVTWTTNAIPAAGCGWAAPINGDLWTAQFMVEDLDAQGGVKSKVPVDVIMKFVAQVGSPPTLTLSTPGPISIPVLTPVSFTATGNDVDANARVTLNATGIPPGAASTNLNQQLIPPVTSTFNWTPTISQGGTYVVTYTATDDTFQQVIKSITIQVESNLAPTISCSAPITTPYNVAASLGVDVADPNGDALTVVWKLDGNVVQTDNVPASFNPTSVTLNRTYGAVGNHPVMATVTDTKNASATCSTAANVVQATQTIDFGALLDRFYSDPSFTISATASSGLPVSFQLISGPVQLAANSVTITGTGLATIAAKQAGNASYLPAADVQQSFEVKPATSTVTVTCPSVGQTYTGTAQTPCTAQATGVGMSPIDVTASLIYTHNTNAGAASAQASWPGDANHSPNTGNGGFSITPAASTVTVVCTAGAPHAYTGSAQTPCTAEATGVGMTPVDVTASLVYASNTNVGLATANGSWDGDANHTSSAGSGGFAITMAASTVAVTCPAAPQTYTGSAQTPCTAQATGAGMSAIDLTTSLSYTNNVVVGLASAQAAWPGDANHTGNTGNATFTISPAASTLTVTCTVGAPYTYTGAPQTPCTAQATGAGMNPVDVSGSLTYAGNTDAGNATANASWDGDSNHTGNTSAGGFTILRAASTVTVTCPSGGLVYTGAAHAPCTAEAAGVGMSAIDVTSLLTYTGNTDVGVASADATWAGDANHTGNAGHGVFTITHAASTVTVVCTAGAPHTYTGSAQTPCTAQATGAGMSPVDVTASVVYSANVYVGTASATATWGGDANHTGTSGAGGFAISPAGSTVTVVCTSGAPHTYTGATQTPCTAQSTGAGMSPINVTASLVYANNVDVGAATANAGWPGDANHNGSNGSGGFTITKAASTTTLTCPSTPQIYTGSPITPCTVAVAGPNLTVSTSAGIVYGNNVLGTATASYTFAGDSNHTGSSDSKTFLIQYGWAGFLQPINDTAHTGLTMSNFKLGQTIPAKFVITTAAGAIVQQTPNPGFRWSYYGQCVGNTTPEAVQTIAPDNLPVYTWDGNQYHYNWSTKGLTAGLYRIFADLADGSHEAVDICLQK